MTALAMLTEDAVRREDFIRAMRCVASSVTVVTTDGPAGRHGATVSAFCSLSADPPSALVCLKADSRIARLAKTNRQFCVNVLSNARSDLAQRFAGCLDATSRDHFAEVMVARSAHPAPVLDGATAFSCDLLDTIKHGGHLILVGRVIQLQIAELAPLTSLNGAYCQVVLQRHNLENINAHHTR